MEGRIAPYTISTVMSQEYEPQAWQRPPVLYGLPCANCRVYFDSQCTQCPVCHWSERVPPAPATIRRPAAAF